MKNLLKRILPKFIFLKLKRIKKKLNLLFLFYLDYKRFERTAGLLDNSSDIEHLRARITFHTHAIEKGLSHENIRLGFGKKALLGLYQALTTYKINGYPKNDLRYQMGISVINEYIKYHEKQNYDITDVKKKFAGFLEEEEKPLSGVMVLNYNDSIKKQDIGFAELAYNRVSVRNFSGKKVDLKLINEAIRISMKTPSICNRQPWEVYVIRDKNVQKKILEYQKGFRGFEDNIDTLILITSNNKYLLSVNERNQGFVAGGMFAMSMLYSLEYLGLAACALNGALPYKNEKMIRDELNIKDSENIIMFIAIGHYPEIYKVPKSKRENYQQITKYI